MEPDEDEDASVRKILRRIARRTSKTGTPNTKKLKTRRRTSKNATPNSEKLKPRRRTSRTATPNTKKLRTPSPHRRKSKTASDISYDQPSLRTPPPFSMAFLDFEPCPNTKKLKVLSPRVLQAVTDAHMRRRRTVSF